MSKNLVLMRDVICKYHPRFVASRDIRKFGLECPDHFNVERLIEESLAAVGNMEFVDEQGYDFLPDYSDSKTVTVNANTRRGEIMSVEHKIGALRITAYNPHTDGADYFYVPKSALREIKQPCYGQNEYKERVVFTYSKNGHYNSFEDFRVKDFDVLSNIRG